VLESGAISFVRKFNRFESTLFCELSFSRAAVSEREVMSNNRRPGMISSPLLQVNYRLLKLVVRVSNFPKPNGSC